MKKGVFYGVGVGPGDAELMTLKAQRVLRECPVLAVPNSGASAAALNIVRAAVDISDKTILDIPMPMTRDREKLDSAHDEAAEKIIRELEQGRDVAMPNIGDVSVYASCAYLLGRVAAAGFETHMIPGVPSFCAAAARLDMSLTTAKKPLVIIPGDAESMDALLEIDGTKVLMKSGKSIADTVKKLENLNLANGARAVENCGMENERVIRDVRELTSGAGYFTTIIIKGAD